MTSLKTIVLGFALSLILATPAPAKQVDLGKHTASEIKATCGREGGDYIRGGNTWSCFKKCEGGTCTVSCDKDGCVGTTPERGVRKFKGQRAVLDTLNNRVR